MILPAFLADVQIETAAVPTELNDATQRGVLWQAAPRRLLIDVPEVARYLIEDGQRITLQPDPHADDLDVQRFLQTTPLAAILYQRNLLAFHAAAVANSNGAILIAGYSGAGKSTLGAALVQRGWQMLTDDLSPVTLDERGNLIVYPIESEIRLWSDAKDHLGQPDRSAVASSPAESKFDHTPRPLRSIFWLMVHGRDQIEWVELPSAERFKTLGRLTYNSQIADALIDRAAYFRIGTALAQAVSLYRLQRPRGHWCLTELADQIESALS